MFYTLSSKPASDNWQCALCGSTKEQGAWLSNVTDSQGKYTSYICDKHRDLTLEEIVAKLDERQASSGQIKIQEIPKVDVATDTHWAAGEWWNFDSETQTWTKVAGVKNE